jgi:hypothetical protein
MTLIQFLPDVSAQADDLRLGASCTLGEAELRERVRQWRALRARSQVAPTPSGAKLVLGPDEDLGAVVDLAAAETQCCPFYSFSLTITGAERALVIDAGPEGASVVGALLGLDEGA